MCLLSGKFRPKIPKLGQKKIVLLEEFRGKIKILSSYNYVRNQQLSFVKLQLPAPQHSSQIRILRILIILKNLRIFTNLQDGINCIYFLHF